MPLGMGFSVVVRKYHRSLAVPPIFVPVRPVFDLLRHRCPAMADVGAGAGRPAFRRRQSKSMIFKMFC
jgi:hypothetical protein